DVVSRCSSTSPASPEYYTNEILFDNVLTGDYQTISRPYQKSSYSTGAPLVHIRAIPEGGPAGMTPIGNAPVTTLPYTFYGRYINGRSVGGVPVLPHYDRRQPLGSTFAARWADFRGIAITSLKIWREGVAQAATCTTAVKNSALPIQEIVRFDEHENPSVTPDVRNCDTL